MKILRFGGLALAFWGIVPAAVAEGRRIAVFVALCDNATQGIQKVGARIGNGDDPANNLYWGCSDGMKLFFKNSARWKLIETKAKPTDEILEQLTFRHTAIDDVELVAYAYRGAKMAQCLADFYAALTGTDYPADLVAFIGHNGLMDGRVPDPEANADAPKRDAVVLCCLSRLYFQDRLESAGIRPILLTEQLMYPGSFLLHDALEGWLRGESRPQIRDRAARAYVKKSANFAEGGPGDFLGFEGRGAGGVKADLTAKSGIFSCYEILPFF